MEDEADEAGVDSSLEYQAKIRHIAGYVTDFCLLEEVPGHLSGNDAMV